MKIISLNKESLKRGCELLAKRDKDLRFVLETHGVPPLWKRREGFPTLVHIILEQQVSLASARAAFVRLKETIKVTPKNFLALNDTTLKSVGFSRQKILYCRLLSEAIIEKHIDLKALSNMRDDDVRTTLKQLKGIGDWTVDIYLLMALSRSDIFPVGDLALAIAVQQVKNLHSRPKPDELIAIAEAWRPFRAVATRIFWHHYLNNRRAKDINK